MLIAGRIAIVVGAVRGIGKACCDALLEKGAKLCFGDVIVQLGQDLEQEYRAKYGADSVLFCECDATSDEALNHLFDEAERYFGKKPEIVLTTVGCIDELNWQRCIDVNIGSCVRIVNIALTRMGVDKGGNGGVIVLTSSKSGLLPEFWGPVYSLTKTALINYARSWAMEKQYKRHQIRFHCLCPGGVDTAFIQQLHNGYFADETLEDVKTIQFIKPSQVADGFIQLVEDE